MNIYRDTTQLEKTIWRLVCAGIAILLVLITVKIIVINTENYRLSRPIKRIEIFNAGTIDIDCNYNLNDKKVVGTKQLKYKFDEAGWEYTEDNKTIKNTRDAVEICGVTYKSIEELSEDEFDAYIRAERLIEIIKEANFNINSSINKDKSYIKFNKDALLNLSVNNNNLVNMMGLCDIYVGNNDKSIKIDVDCLYEKDNLTEIDISYTDFLNAMVAYNQAKGAVEGSSNTMTGYITKLIFRIRPI